MEYNENDLNNVVGGVDREVAAEKLSKLFKEVKKEELEEKNNSKKNDGELFEEDLDKYLGGIPQGAYQDDEFMKNHR